MAVKTDNVAAYYINLDARQDRRRDVEPELAVFDFTVHRLVATETPGRGYLGCAQSHVRALQAGLASGKPYIAVFEDDFQWEAPAAVCVQRIKAIPPVFDVLCLSYYARCVEVDFDKHVDGLCAPARNIQTCTAYIVTRTFAEQKLVPCFQRAVEQLQHGALPHQAAIDVAWKQLQTDHRFYVTIPRLARQAVSHSDIIGQTMDYFGGCFTLDLTPNASRLERQPFFGCATTPDNLWDTIQRVRKEFPNIGFILILDNNTTTTTVQDLFATWQFVANPRQRPTALLGERVGDSEVGGDCMINRTLMDALAPPTTTNQSWLASTCLRLGRNWVQQPCSQTCQTCAPARSAAGTASQTASAPAPAAVVLRRLDFWGLPGANAQ